MDVSTGKTVFVSQAEPSVAGEIEVLVEKAFDGRVRTFNTARYNRGLHAGDHLDPALFSALETSDAVISVWSPRSVAHPAWMSWELGVAAAVQRRPVLVARALGVEAQELPLDLPTRYAPDLGNEDQALEFFRNLGEAVGSEISESAFRETYARHATAKHPSPLRARHALSSRVSIGRFQKRGLIENLTEELLEKIEVSALSTDPYAAALAEVITDALATQVAQDPGASMRGLRLLPHERIVFPVPADEPPASDAVRVEWTVADAGREYEDMTVIGTQPGRMAPS